MLNLDLEAKMYNLSFSIQFLLWKYIYIANYLRSLVWRKKSDEILEFKKLVLNWGSNPKKEIKLSFNSCVTYISFIFNNLVCL